MSVFYCVRFRSYLSLSIIYHVSFIIWGLEFWVLGLGFGFGVLGLWGFGVLGSGVWVLGLELGVWGFRARGRGSGVLEFGGWGLGFGVLCLETNLCNAVSGLGPMKVDVRLPGKENSNSHGARPVHLIITMIKWIRTSRLSIKNYLSGWGTTSPHEFLRVQ